MPSPSGTNTFHVNTPLPPSQSIYCHRNCLNSSSQILSQIPEIVMCVSFISLDLSIASTA
ncbi:uncharacterized protein BO88DRAFT_400007 [Aspergillus vadensis CBS 113365]|uniref:Uncharacterized protein n=1 Tax=Aspergillus vadensis (strain CBS 113365 / IMI 142717 / IBT 24658) TaxID=1448311 RepID=A0A319BST8_ASPVC|nr:hypothetical protein BO88DRAFT_400007 [Aspergillus vadensis CBS 113365]PYH74320.1 hypothetical protein BO88DRAFT_400007 [Aspergillus vadensis CBS 113365]